MDVPHGLEAQSYKQPARDNNRRTKCNSRRYLALGKEVVLSLLLALDANSGKAQPRQTKPLAFTCHPASGPKFVSDLEAMRVLHANVV